MFLGSTAASSYIDHAVVGHAESLFGTFAQPLSPIQHVLPEHNQKVVGIFAFQAIAVVHLLPNRMLHNTWMVPYTICRSCNQ